MEKKLRHSRQRERILEYLCQTGEHPTAEQIYQDLRLEIPGLSLGTVYRNLKLLEETGQIRRVTTLQNVERYDAHCGDHAHFICNSCGKVKDLSVVDRQVGSQSCNVDPGDRVEWMNVTFGGVCGECAVKNAQ